LSNIRIRRFYNYFDGEVTVCFSGGKKSIVLLDLVRNIFPDVEAIFIDTKSEIKEHVMKCSNLTIINSNDKKNEFNINNHDTINKYLEKFMVTSNKKLILGNIAWKNKKIEQAYLNLTCNSYNKGISQPIGFWKDEDILNYLNKYNLNFCFQKKKII